MLPANRRDNVSLLNELRGVLTVTTDLDPFVTFQTSVQWLFSIPEPDQPQPLWGGTRYRPEFLAGQILQVPRSIAMAREQAGIGTIIRQTARAAC